MSGGSLLCCFGTAVVQREFMEDLTTLGVRPPDVLTRVSEYIPEVCF